MDHSNDINNNIASAYLKMLRGEVEEVEEHHEKDADGNPIPHDDEINEDNTNDKSDDGDGMDKVQPKALKKKFKNRKDKDIDNDGDEDGSDEYLHNRRKTVSKAIDKDDESDEPVAKTDRRKKLDKKDGDADMEAEGYGKKMKKEELQAKLEGSDLDEISKKTLGNYIRRSADDLEHHGFTVGANKPKQDYNKAANRRIGIRKATDRLTKEELQAKLDGADLYEKMDIKQKDRLDDLLNNLSYGHSSYPYDDNAPDPDKVQGMIKKEFGSKIADQVKAYYDKKGSKTGQKLARQRDDSLKRTPTRVSKSGKANKQDVANLKKAIKGIGMPGLQRKGTLKFEAVEKEGNMFTKALMAARKNGDKKFIVGTKSYNTEDYAESAYGTVNSSRKQPKAGDNDRNMANNQRSIPAKGVGTAPVRPGTKAQQRAFDKADKTAKPKDKVSLKPMPASLSRKMKDESIGRTAGNSSYHNLQKAKRMAAKDGHDYDKLPAYDRTHDNHRDYYDQKAKTTKEDKAPSYLMKRIQEKANHVPQDETRDSFDKQVAGRRLTKTFNNELESQMTEQEFVDMHNPKNADVPEFTNAPVVHAKTFKSFRDSVKAGPKRSGDNDQGDKNVINPVNRNT